MKEIGKVTNGRNIECVTFHLSYSYLMVQVFCLSRRYDRGPTQSVSVADCYFIVSVLDLPFASPIAIYRFLHCLY